MASIGKISEFKEAIQKIVRPNLFYAELTGTDSLLINNNSSIPEIKDTFSFRCEAAEFPGRTITTVDDVGAGGPSLKLPYDVTYNDTNISVICAEDMTERIFFELWMESIVATPQSKTLGNAGLISYHSSYARQTELIIRQLNPAGNTIFWYKLHDVFPIAITPMNATWEESNTYQRFGVTLNYRYYTFGNTEDSADTASRTFRPSSGETP
jgi:hypothetical protein